MSIGPPSRTRKRPYRGRLAPTPSGWLHSGHAATFRTTWERARKARGTLVYRLEDTDPDNPGAYEAPRLARLSSRSRRFSSNAARSGSPAAR